MINVYEPETIEEFQDILNSVPVRGRGSIQLEKQLIDMLSIFQLKKAAASYNIVLRGIDAANSWRKKINNGQNRSNRRRKKTKKRMV